MRTEKWLVEPQRQGDWRIVEIKLDSASVRAIRIYGRMESLDGIFEVTLSGSPTIICPRTLRTNPATISRETC